MLEKSYLLQNGVELNFLFIGLASRPAVSLRINLHIREDSKGVHGGGRKRSWPLLTLAFSFWSRRLAHITRGGGQKRSWPLLTLTFFFLSFFYMHCFSPTSVLPGKLIFYGPSYFDQTRRNIIVLYHCYWCISYLIPLQGCPETFMGIQIVTELKWICKKSRIRNSLAWQESFNRRAQETWELWEPGS